ncbi:MAG TPA: polysaccharide lyase family protein [Opitutaceae bacterium]|nr:polysaccharide lyase family protein [Opitutaceae bacterium]
MPFAVFPKRTAFSFAALLVTSAALAGAGRDPAVTFRDDAFTLVLDNGIVALEIAKENGAVVHFAYRGKSLLSGPAYLDWQSDGNHHFSAVRCRIVTDPATNGGDLAEIAIEQSGKGQRPAFDVAQHFVLRRGESGCHVFAVFHHASNYPAASIDQSRWVLRVDESVFDFINVDDQRRAVMPPGTTPVRTLDPKEAMQFTEGPWQGRITDKYHFFAEAGDHFVHGWSGTKSNLGLWLIDGSREDHNGGPTKQHNTAHFGGVLLKILTCVHYGAHAVEIPKGMEWTKVYGPWLLYANSGGTPDALWADAKRQAEEQRRAWPFSWMHHPHYPDRMQRGEVRGRITVHEGSPAMLPGAWVGLAAASPDWQQQSNGYQFWGHMDADGTFAIPNVRAGTYTLYAFAPGLADEFRRDEVTVAAGRSLELGELAWRPPHFGRLLWQVGIPDRTAREFRYGDNHRRWGLWRHYATDFPQGVNFRIGSSRERTDWNYAQVTVNDRGQWRGTAWDVEFEAPDHPMTGTATLRLAIASAHAAQLVVSLNGHKLDGFDLSTDNAMARAGIRGQYTLRDVPFKASRLRPGRNVLTLEQQTGRNMLPNVMYDSLQLYLDEQRRFETFRDTPRFVIGANARNAGEDND